MVLPTGADFSEAEAEVVFRNKKEEGATSNVMADIIYSWYGHFVGSTTLDVNSPVQNAFSFSADSNTNETEGVQQSSIAGEKETEPEKEKEYLKINVWYVLFAVLGISVLIGLWYLMNATRQQRERWKRIRRQKRQMRRIERRRKKRKYYPTRRLR